MQLAPLFPLLHPLLASSFPTALWAGDRQRPEIALTFDDGPHPYYTPALLEVLQHYQIPASFFWLGACVQRSPHVARSVFEQGHWLGLHGFDHRSFPTLSTLELKTSLARTQQTIAQACDLPPDQVRDVRPPNGLFTPQILKQLTQWNYRPVMWSVVPEDWVGPGVSVVVRRVLQQARNGSIIVLHDGACGGQAIVETVAQLIPALLARQYQFVTINRFWLPPSSP